ncbi:MAG: hypothetical protein RLZZ385_2328 [Pseudomonadota bacterium]|jgi:hypothetical protein
MFPAYRPSLLKFTASATLLLLLALSISGTLDRRADAPLAASFERALITFAVVRGINAIVSVVQGTEVAIEPAGVGVILTPGQVFDPINDLIEQFSWIVLAASASLGAQRVLLSIGGSVAAQGVVVLAIVVLLGLQWRPSLLAPGWRTLLSRLALGVLLVRFVVPLVVILNEAVYASFLSARYDTAYAALEQTEQEVQALQEAESAALAGEPDAGMLEAIARWYDRTTQRINVSARLQEYEAKLSNASERIVDLIVVFVLQTLVFPLLFLWLMVKAGGAAITGRLWR